ncbi:hypothetical protein M422DRAFT_251839 [Sphaerobolus stellatus SS14]|uniref:Zn(2)-C6 fungal-type domain-containing protein n=1 Tax=Sphaerobolus stellatus (strain SS14) TaxID=990650 RepID=A0A0C9W1K3_SPHS4|nr:hypothetical protein M422DRAFT_251839 [Sphaerobolus stellatus SS14]
MTDLQLPAHILAWKTSEEVVHMEEISAGNPRRTVLGFQANDIFDWPGPKFAFDDPFEEEEDRLPKVTCYWKACDQERTQPEEAAQKQREAQEEGEKAKEKEREQEKRKEQEKEKGKEKEAGPSGNAKGKAREVSGDASRFPPGTFPSGTIPRVKHPLEAIPRGIHPQHIRRLLWPESGRFGWRQWSSVPKTPKKITPKKSKRDVHLESEEEEEEEESEECPACVYCMQKKIKCVLLDDWKVCTACHKRKVKCEFFDKTTWAVMDGSEKIAEAVQDLTRLEWHRTASLLEKSWYDMDIYALNLEQTVDRDLMEADGKVLTLLDMNSRGVEIPADVEKRIMSNWGSIVASYTTHMEHIFTRMNLIWKRTVWTKNDLPESTIGEPETDPSNRMEESGTKRKAEESGGRMEITL